jgi:hypothetical protein
VRYAPGKNSEGFTAAFAIGTPKFVEAASKKATLGGEVLVIVGKDYDSLLHRFNDVPGTAVTATTLPGATPTSVAATTVPTTAAAPTTTSTTAPAEKFDERFVPVDPKTGGPLVGCPT